MQSPQEEEAMDVQFRQRSPFAALAVLSLVLALAALTALIPGASAAPPLQAPPQSFGETIDVRVVNVEVVVTDRQGERVRGLGAADFELLVDGAPVAIDYFTEVVEGETAGPAAAAATAQAAPPAPVPAGRVGRSYLLFIDESFSLATQRDQVLERLERELPRLAPEDRAAVVAFDGRRLDLLTPWTSDQTALAATLQAARRRPSAGIAVLAARRSSRREEALVRLADEDISARGRGPGLRATIDQERGERWLELEARTESAVAAASAALRAVPPPEGRKIMLLLSGGWPFVADDELLRRDPTTSTGRGVHLPSGRQLYGRLAETANLLGYTIYPVDVTGIDALSTNSDAEGESPGDIKDLAITSAWEQETHDALHFLARETGGRPVLNSARLEVLPRVDRDTSTYYWLGFTPQWQADDRSHRLAVRVARPGLVVRARSGFTDLSRSATDLRRTEGVLLFGGPPEDRRLRVEVGPIERGGRGTMKVPITVVVPTDRLTVMPVADGYRFEATLTAAALDPWGGRSELPEQPLQMTLPQPPVPGSFARYQTDLRLRRAPHRVVFAVHDKLSSGMLWAEADIAP
jgi:VWFA-related protein